MSQRTTYSPMKITLEMHTNTMTWEGGWDTDFESLFDAFCGLASTGGFGDKKELKKFIYDRIHEEFWDEFEEENKEVKTEVVKSRQDEQPVFFQDM